MCLHSLAVLSRLACSKACLLPGVWQTVTVSHSRNPKALAKGKKDWQHGATQAVLSLPYTSWKAMMHNTLLTEMHMCDKTCTRSSRLSHLTSSVRCLPSPLPTELHHPLTLQNRSACGKGNVLVYGAWPAVPCVLAPGGPSPQPTHLTVFVHAVKNRAVCFASNTHVETTQLRHVLVHGVRGDRP